MWVHTAQPNATAWNLESSAENEPEDWRGGFSTELGGLGMDGVKVLSASSTPALSFDRNAKTQ
jgi:hypothetical protein